MLRPMKTARALLATVFLAVPIAPAQAPATSKSVTLDVAENNGDAATLTRWATAYGSFDKTKAATRALGITLHNMSATVPGEFEVEWFFFGKPAGGGKRFLHDKGSQRIVAKPSAIEKIAVASKELVSARYRSGYSGYTSHSGQKPDGWIVRVKSGEEVIRVKTSDAQLGQLEHDKAAFDAMLKTLPTR